MIRRYALVGCWNKGLDRTDSGLEEVQIKKWMVFNDWDSAVVLPEQPALAATALFEVEKLGLFWS